MRSTWLILVLGMLSVFASITALALNLRANNRLTRESLRDAQQCEERLDVALWELELRRHRMRAESEAAP